MQHFFHRSTQDWITRMVMTLMIMVFGIILTNMGHGTISLFWETHIPLSILDIKPQTWVYLSVFPPRYHHLSIVAKGSKDDRRCLLPCVSTLLISLALRLVIPSPPWLFSTCQAVLQRWLHPFLARTKGLLGSLFYNAMDSSH